MTRIVLQMFLDSPDSRVIRTRTLSANRRPGGTIYPLLRQLERHGVTQSRMEECNPTIERRPARKYYKLTARGECVASACALGYVLAG
jgi:PadR family transcriptional regulator, regulatory protein PadR